MLVFNIETIACDPEHPAARAVIERAGQVAIERLTAGYDGPGRDSARAEAAGKLGLSPWTASIGVFACWDTVTEAGTCLVVGDNNSLVVDGFKVIDCATEADLVNKAWRGISARRTVVSWNGIEFDQPFLVARAMAHGVQVSLPLVRAKPWDDAHIDLCLRTAMGFKGKSSLNVARLALGIDSPKTDLEGAHVTAAWHAGRRGDVAAYCCGDVRATTAILESWCVAHSMNPKAP